MLTLAEMKICHSVRRRFERRSVSLTRMATVSSLPLNSGLDDDTDDDDDDDDDDDVEQ